MLLAKESGLTVVDPMKFFHQARISRYLCGPLLARRRRIEPPRVAAVVQTDQLSAFPIPGNRFAIRVNPRANISGLVGEPIIHRQHDRRITVGADPHPLEHSLVKHRVCLMLIPLREHAGDVFGVATDRQLVRWRVVQLVDIARLVTIITGQAVA